MRKATKTFDDLDDHFSLHFTDTHVRIERNAETIYDGPVSNLIAEGKSMVRTVGWAIQTNINIVQREVIGSMAQVRLYPDTRR
jgi:hypothetical protein